MGRAKLQARRSMLRWVVKNIGWTSRPRSPKGMRWTTDDRRVASLSAYYSAFDPAWSSGITRLLAVVSRDRGFDLDVA
jgi:hypothetical protein